MDYTYLGRTGLQVSRLCLGTMNFGPQTTPQDSHAIMDAALDLGINFFDTADVYGWKEHEGWTEKIIGDWLAQGGGRRQSIVLATKCYNEMWDGPNGKGLSAYHIKRACEESLRRLQTEHIDLYQMHHVDRETPWEEIWEAMEQLRREGKILYVGSSNFAGWHIATANQEAGKRNFMGLVCEQSKYSLLCRDIELEVLPACEGYGLGCIAWSPLASGALAGAVRREAKEGRRAQKGVQNTIDAHRAQLEQWEALCEQMGEEPADVALAWILSNPAMTGPIIGPRTMGQLVGAMRALEIELDEEGLARIDEIFPGPGGPAPEAYAW